MILLFYISTIYLSVVTLNYFLIKWYIHVGPMTADDFDYTSTRMWIPGMNVIIVLALFSFILGSYIMKIENHMEIKRSKRKPTYTFRERLFGVKLNGKIVEKNEKAKSK